MTLVPLVEPGWMNAIVPEIILCLGGMLLILWDAFAPRAKGILAPLALIILIIGAWSEQLFKSGTFFGGMYEFSGITHLFDITFFLAAMLATLFARDYLDREGNEGGEFYALLLWGTVGMMMMAKGLDLLIIVLGLETLSICIFVLVGYARRLPISNEASLKYFLMGAFATGFILYGTALFYGATQSTNITVMARYFATADPSNQLLTIAFASSARLCVEKRFLRPRTGLRRAKSGTRALIEKTHPDSNKGAAIVAASMRPNNGSNSVSIVEEPP